VPQKIVVKVTSPQTVAALMSQRIGRVVSLWSMEYISRRVPIPNVCSLVLHHSIYILVYIHIIGM
jgi:hypothetical protein